MLVPKHAYCPFWNRAIPFLYGYLIQDGIFFPVLCAYCAVFLRAQAEILPVLEQFFFFSYRLSITGKYASFNYLFQNK